MRIFAPLAAAYVGLVILANWLASTYIVHVRCCADGSSAREVPGCETSMKHDTEESTARKLLREQENPRARLVPIDVEAATDALNRLHGDADDRRLVAETLGLLEGRIEALLDFPEIAAAIDRGRRA